MKKSQPEYFKISPIKLLEKKNIFLNDKQKEIIKSVNENRVTIVVATRRGGKSEIASACNVAKLLEPNTFCGLTAPFLTQTEIVWDNIVDTFKDTLDIKPSKINNKDKNLKFPWFSQAKATTLKNRKTIAGRAYDLFTGDEVGLAEYMTDSNFLFQEILPATITTAGHVLIISTPRGLNFLYDLWEIAESEKQWNRIRYTIHETTHIPKEEIENMERLYREQHMEKMWEQEYMASFISFEGAIFNFVPDFVESVPDPDLVLVGIDPGTKHATIKLCINKKYGVFVVFCEESEKSTSEHGKLLQKLTIDTDLAVCDSAARQFIQDMTYDYEVSLQKANKDVEQGVNFLRRLDGHIHIHKDVDPIFVKEWSTYSHKDGKIVKKADHTIDALRYALFTAYTFWPEYFPFLNNEPIPLDL